MSKISFGIFFLMFRMKFFVKSPNVNDTRLAREWRFVLTSKFSLFMILNTVES